MPRDHALTDAPAWNEQLAALERDGAVSQPWVAAAIDWLRFARAGIGLPLRRILDVGSGPGHAAAAWADAVPYANVVAVDPTPEFVERARQRAVERGLDGRLSAIEASVEDGLDRAPAADLIWCSHVVHHLDDPLDGLRRLGARLERGGWLAVAEGGLPMRVLPAGLGVATPSFLMRVEATLSDYFIERWALPGLVVRGERDWPLLLRDAGLSHVQSKTFVLDLPAPVGDDVRAHVVDHYAHVRDLIGDRLSHDDRASLDRLLDPADPLALANRADLFLLSAQTVHVARLA